MLRFILLFLCFSTYVSAQEETALNKESKRLEELCKKYSQNADSLNFYGKKLLEFGKKNNFNRGKMEGYFAIGYSLSKSNNQDIFITYLDSALLFQEDLIDTHFSDVTRIIRNKGIAYFRKGEFQKSEQIFLDLKEMCIAKKEYKNLTYVYNSLGVLEKEKENYKKALEYYKLNLDIWDQLQQEIPKAATFLNIGIAQANLNNHKQAYESFHFGLKIAKKHNLKRDLYRYYNNLANNLIATQNNDSATYYLNKIIPYYKQTNQKFPLHLAYMNLGHLKLVQKQNDSAKLYFFKSLKGIKESQNFKQTAQNYTFIAQTFFYEKQYELALKYLDSANTISSSKGYKANLEKEMDWYAKIHEKLGDFEKANNMLKIKDSIVLNKYQAETTNGLTEILVTHNVKKKDETISKLTEDKFFYKSNLFLSFLVVFILGIISFFLFKRYKNQKDEVQQLQNELEIYNQKFENSEKTETSSLAILKLKSNAVLNTNEILYIKSDGHYAEIFLAGKEKPEIERISLTALLDLLPEIDFVRIHKSYVVNIHKIKIINSTQLMLENGEWIKLSRTYKQELKDLLHKK